MLKSCCYSLLALFTCVSLAAETPADGPNASAARQALASARHYLIRQLDYKTGRTVLEYDEGSARHGIETALVLRALSLAGERYDQSPPLRRGYAWLIKRPREATELVALRVSAIAAASSVDEALYQCLADDVKWLIDAASDEGHYSSESLAGKSQLNYQSALADLVTEALEAASRQDVLIPARHWERLARAWVHSQLPAGGWKYSPQDWAGPQYGANFTMSAAGICGLAISLRHLGPGGEAEVRTSAEKCLKLGREWLDAKFALPKRNHPRDYCYDSHRFPGPVLDAYSEPELYNRWLINLGRLKKQGGFTRLGDGDPWSALTAELVRFQNDDGSWGGGTWSSGIFKIQLTASATIFLATVSAE